MKLNMNEKIKIRLERLKTLRTTYFHALSDNPEEDAWKKAEKWVEQKGLLTNMEDAGG